jgi:uncharacterized protein YxeA
MKNILIILAGMALFIGGAFYVVDTVSACIACFTGAYLFTTGVLEITK